MGSRALCYRGTSSVFSVIIFTQLARVNIIKSVLVLCYDKNRYHFLLCLHLLKIHRPDLNFPDATLFGYKKVVFCNEKNVYQDIAIIYLVNPFQSAYFIILGLCWANN